MPGLAKSTSMILEEVNTFAEDVDFGELNSCLM
jgi:hypothetical protein